MKISAMMRKPGALYALNGKLFNPLLIRQLMRVSGLAIILLLITLQVLLAASVKGQSMLTDRVTIGMRDEALSAGLKKIEQQTTLRFFHRKADTELLRNISLPVKTRTIEETLNDMLQNSFFSFRQIDNHILLERANTQVGYEITGMITGIDRKAIEAATVNLFKIDTKKYGQTTLTDVNGRFKLTASEKGNYLVKISTMGMDSLSVAITLGELKLIRLPDITLVASHKQLQEIVITSNKPLIRQEIDRIVYDVQVDPANKGENMLEMMRKVPLLSLDAEDNVKLKGNSNYKILINGRASTMMTNNPRDVLRSIPASSIQQIEVITTPPAKYDGEGLAGIINIVTSRKIEQGYKGAFGSYYNYALGKGMFANSTVKLGKFGIYGSVSRYFRRFLGSTSSSYRTGIGSIQSTVRQEIINNRNDNSGNLKRGNIDLSYDIDSLNLLTGYIALNAINSNQNSNQLFGIFDQGDNLDQSYGLNNDVSANTNGTDIGINYQLGFKKDKGKLLTVSYNYTSFNNIQKNRNVATNRFNYTNDDLQQKNKSGSTEQTIQLDYIQTVKKIGIEGGIKLISRDHYSDFVSENFAPTVEQLNPTSTIANQFDYVQTIYAFYNSYQLKLKDWGIKVGLRVERTDIGADFITLQTNLQRNYINFIPSVIIQRNFDRTTSMNLGYTQRIQRPGIGQLNPYVNQVTPLFYTSGNPNLLPVLNQNFELSYRNFKKGSVNVSLDYSFASNTIQNVVTLGIDSITRSSFENIGKNNNLGLNVNINYPISGKLSVNFNGRLSHLWVNGMFNGKLYENKGYVVNFSNMLSYSFKNDWRASVYISGNSPLISLQARTNDYYFYSGSISKDLFKKKVSITASAYNPFKKYRSFINQLNTPDFIQYTNTQNYYRNFYVNFYYHFGNLKEALKKNKRGVNNDDIEKEKE